MMRQFEVWKGAHGQRWLMCSDRPYYDRVWGFWRVVKGL